MPRTPKKRLSSLPAEQHIPRPANCFILFRAAYLKSKANSTSGDNGRQQQKDVSQEAAAAWNALSPAEKEPYKVQAEIAKAEHARMYPGWVYRPKMKRRVKPAEGEDSSANGNLDVASRQSSPLDAEREGRAAAPKNILWDSSWFAGTTSMTDPFYSAPLEPLASTTTVPPQIVPNHTHLSSMAHTHGFGVVPNVHAMPSIRNPRTGLRNGESHHPGDHDHNTLDSEGDPLSLSTGDSTPVLSSSAEEVPTLASEVEPPTHSLMKSLGFTWDEFSESYCYNHDWEWEVNPALHPDFDSVSPMEM